MKKPTLVKLPNGNWVNPAFVSAIELRWCGNGSRTIVWCQMNAGYGTGQIYESAGDCRAALAKLLNHPA